MSTNPVHNSPGPAQGSGPAAAEASPFAASLAPVIYGVEADDEGVSGSVGARDGMVVCVCVFHWYRHFPDPVITLALGSHSSHALISKIVAP